jgi:hypothetical protein
VKVAWWWLVVVAAVVWWWRGQRDELAAFKNTPGYKAQIADGVDPLHQTSVQTPPGGNVSLTNPQGTSAWTP